MYGRYLQSIGSWNGHWLNKSCVLPLYNEVYITILILYIIIGHWTIEPRVFHWNGGIPYKSPLNHHFPMVFLWYWPTNLVENQATKNSFFTFDHFRVPRSRSGCLPADRRRHAKHTWKTAEPFGKIYVILLKVLEQVLMDHDFSGNSVRCVYQWIGSRENLQESHGKPLIFKRKIYMVSCKFSRKPIHWQENAS